MALARCCPHSLMIREIHTMSMEGYSPEEQRRRKLATDCYKRGSEAMAKQNWDYSCEMFGTAVKVVPDNVVYRQSLRGVQRKKYKDNKTGASMAFLKINSIRSKRASASRNRSRPYGGRRTMFQSTRKRARRWSS